LEDTEEEAQGDSMLYLMVALMLNATALKQSLHYQQWKTLAQAKGIMFYRSTSNLH